jgi:hypothetical protein
VRVIIPNPHYTGRQVTRAGPRERIRTRHVYALAGQGVCDC